MEGMGSMATLNQDDNPYVGPRTFRPDERAKFFGRSREARELTSLIIANRLVLFYSPSGAGKSSLLNTMIIPMLAEAGFEVLPTGRVSGYVGSEVTTDNIYVYNLLLSLQGSDEITEDFSELTLTQFLDNLVCHQDHQDDRYFYDPDYVYPPDTVFMPRVLIIDQFEELVTTNTAFWPQRGDFFSQLAEAMRLDKQLWVVLTMREDYVARLDPYLYLLPDRLRHRYHMERLARPAAVEAMQMPVKKIRPFTANAIEKLANNLLRIRAANDNQDENRLAQFVEPVQLQAVCYQMWQELRQQPGEAITADDVERFADVDKALTNFYEETIRQTVQATDISEVALREWFENELITEAGTRNMVYRGEEMTGMLPTAVAEAVLSRFIIREEVRPGGVWYELVHDRLVQPIINANHSWRLKQPLPRLAQRWANGGRTDDLLLHDRDLGHLTRDNDWRLLGPLVVEFVNASQKAQNQEMEKARKKEMQHQVKMAEAEKRRAEAERQRAEEAVKAAVRQQRLRTIAFAVAGLAFILAIWAVWASVHASAQRTEAIQSGRTAVAAQGTAQAESIRAYAESTRAYRESVNARTQSTRAAENETAAKAAEADARSSAALAEARRLAYPAEQFLRRGNVAGALLVSREIYNRIAEVDPRQTDTTIQDRYGSLWLALNAAANNRLPASESFRRSVAIPEGTTTGSNITLGPEPGTIATWLGNEFAWWAIDADAPAIHTYQLPTSVTTITHAVVSYDRTLLLVASESAVYLLRKNGTSFELNEEEDSWPIDGDSVAITAVALSPNSQQLAVAFCRQPAFAPAAPGSGQTATPTPIPPSDRDMETAVSTAVECMIHKKPSAGLSGETSHEIPARNNRVLAMTFVDEAGTALVWSNRQALHLESFGEAHTWQTPPAESNRRYQALTVMQDSGWLVAGGCQIEDGQCSQGFLRWWHLEQGIWLPAADTLSLPVAKLLYLPERQTLVSADTNGRVSEWQAAIDRWPELACQIAGRNLTVTEWRETFPADGGDWQENIGHSQPLTRTCHEFGLDRSFAAQALLRCEEETVTVAGYLFNRSHPAPASAGPATWFEVWAPSLLFHEALVASERAEACLAIASTLDKTLDRHEILAIIQDFDELQKRDLLSKVGNPDYTQAVGALADKIEQTVLPPELVATLNPHLLGLYAEACAMRLTIPEEDAACTAYEQLQQRLSIKNDLTVVPVSGQAGRWLFYGQGDTFVNVNYLTPFLTVSTLEGRLLTRGHSQATTGYPGQISVYLPESGDYYLEVNRVTGDLEHILPVVSVHEPPTLPFDEVLDVTQLQQTWQFTAVPGEIIAINVESIDAADWFDLALQIRNEQRQLLLSDVLREDRLTQRFVVPGHGAYYISMHWELGNPDRHSVSLSRIIPQKLAVAEPVMASAADYLWVFTGNQGDVVRLDLKTSAEDGWPRLFVYDAYGSLLAVTGDHIETGDLVLETILGEHGSYMAEVDWWGTGGLYTMTLNLPEVAIITLEDENGIEANAGQSWWRFEGRAGQAITITMDALEADGDPYLRLYNPSGHILSEDDDSGDGGEGRNALIKFVLQEDGLHTIHADWYTNPVRYRLGLISAEPKLLDFPVETETTDVFNESLEAKPTVPEVEFLQVGQTRAGSGDRSVWQFEGVEGELIEIVLEALGPNIYLTMNLYDNNYNWITFDDDGGEGLNPFIQFLVPEDGVYYLVADSYRPDNLANNYQIALRLATEPSPTAVAETAVYLISQGYVTNGLDLLHQSAATLPGWQNNNVCRYGSLWGHAADVMFACQTAVFLDPNNPDFADSRGIARAMIGDFAGAISDFRYYAEFGWYETDLRREWIAELAAGRNPLADESLRQTLRGQ
jgi:hypothetical protein